MKWIITGGAGFIGKNLAIELLKQLQSVVVVDKKSWDESGYEDVEIINDLSAHFTYLQRDLTRMSDLDFTDWFSDGGGDVVVHLAAMSGVKECSAIPRSAFEINLKSTFMLLDGAADFHAGCFVFASSGAVVADSNMDKPSEVTVPRTANVYGSMKASGEQLCRGFSKERGLNTAAIRFSNVYGPYSQHKKSVAHSFVRSALNADPLVVHGDGKQTRDFVFVLDVAHGIIEAGKFFRKGAKIFHISTGVETAIFNAPAGEDSLYDQVCEAVGARDMAVEITEDDPGVLSASLNSEFSRRVLCIGSPTPLKSGIKDTVDWYKENSD